MPLGDDQALLADPLQGAEQQDELDNAGIILFQMPQQPMTSARCVNGSLDNVRPIILRKSPRPRHADRVQYWPQEELH